MKPQSRCSRTVFLVRFLVLSGGFAGAPLPAQNIFTDDFSAGASPLWSNTRGNWVVANGSYTAQQPSNNPLTFSGLPFQLKDFVLSVDINDVADGGIWLRCTPDAQNGVLLVTGGNGWGSGDRAGAAGRSLYWHVLQNGVAGPKLNEIFDVITSPGVQDIRLTIRVEGDVYAVHVNHAQEPVAVLTNALFVSGGVGVYDFSEQTFDNVALGSVCAGIRVLRSAPAQVQLCWWSSAGRSYVVETATNFSPGAWRPLLTNVAVGEQTCVLVPIESPTRFYRLVCQ